MQAESSSADNNPNQQEELISDFSCMFKGKAKFRKAPLLRKKQEPASKSPNWLLEIPAKLAIDREDLLVRKVFDTRKWGCMTKTTGDMSLRIISALTSSWNYLYSCKGTAGTAGEKFLTLKRATQFVQDKDPTVLTSEDQEFKRAELAEKIAGILGEATGCRLHLKPAVKLQPPGQIFISQNEQQHQFLTGLKSETSTYVYFTYQDIFCPLGYEVTPLKPLDAYVKTEEIAEASQQLWIINSSTHRAQPSFHIKRCSDICKDLGTTWPKFLDLKDAKRGIQDRPEVTEQNQFEERGTASAIWEVTRD